MNGILGRVAIVLGCALLASLFTWLNAGESVTLRLGFVTLRSISLSAVVFGSILFGMGLLFFAVVTFAAVNLPSVSTWTLVGTRIRLWLTTPRRLRAFNWTMAVLLMASLWPLLAG